MIFRHRTAPGSALLLPLVILITAAIAAPALAKPFYLRPNRVQAGLPTRGLLMQEILRQSVLIAARDELGLQTRDGHLREWRGNVPMEFAQEMSFGPTNVMLADKPGSKVSVWSHDYPADWITDYSALVENAESMSRNEFVAVIEKDGWTGSPNDVKESAPAPADGENLLAEMEQLSQLAAVRETHALIHGDGESLDRLGVLVRGYANLGQLTRFQWSQEYAVFQARSLLYAQRMVVAHPESPVPLWHRAYARALAGFQKDALKDLAAAADMKGATAPPWVALIEPLCHYQTGKLVAMSAGDDHVGKLALFLAFLTVEQSASQGALMDVAQTAMAKNPECLRIIDAMCRNSGPGMLNELSEVGPQTFSQTLGKRLQTMPDLPKAIADRIQQLKREGGNPQGREEICQALIDQSDPAHDTSEPSLATLARMVQETTFAHIHTRINLITEQWGVDGSDYAAEVLPQLNDHPFKFVIQAYGVRHTSSENQMGKYFQQASMMADHSVTLRLVPIYNVAYYLKIGSASPATDAIVGWMVHNTDASAWDLEQLSRFYGTGDAKWSAEILANLQRVDPDSPLILENAILNHWDPAQAKRWEYEQGDYPTIAMALAKHYLSQSAWTDAQRCLNKYIAVSPDYTGYEALAKSYDDAGNHDQWRATLDRYINEAPAFGLEHETAQCEIARDYMKKGDYQKALPYADRAYQSAAQWAISCDAFAHQGIGDWAGAERMVRENVDHYSETPLAWYIWCNHTGHGDLKKSLSVTLDFLNSKGPNASDEELLRLGYLQQSLKKYPEAIAAFQTRLDRAPGPVSAMGIALIADATQDAATRDKMLGQLATYSQGDANYMKLGSLMETAIATGPTVTPDPAAVIAVIDAKNDVFEQRGLCAYAAAFCLNRGKKDQALIYLKKAVPAQDYFDCSARILVDSQLRDIGVDPMSLDTYPPAK